jgi:small-conductance mechanosensitive channel
MNETGILENSVNTLNTFFSGLISKFIVAIIIILLGFIIGKLLGKLVQKLLLDMKFNNIVKNAIGFKVSASEFIGRLITTISYIISIFIALLQLGITATIFQILLGLLFILVLVTMYIELVHFFPNFLANVFLVRRDLVKEGDMIRIGTVAGKVMEVNLTETMIEAKNGDIIYVPNELLRKNLFQRKKR